MGRDKKSPATDKASVVSLSIRPSYHRSESVRSGPGRFLGVVCWIAVQIVNLRYVYKIIVYNTRRICRNTNIDHFGYNSAVARRSAEITCQRLRRLMRARAGQPLIELAAQHTNVPQNVTISRTCSSWHSTRGYKKKQLLS